MRWDGVQFAVDVARPQDRIALVLYRARASSSAISSTAPASSSLSQNYPKFGGKTGREVLTALIKEIQEQEESWAKKIKTLQEAGKQPKWDEFLAFHFKLFPHAADRTVKLRTAPRRYRR